jgi:hypothetical protein
MNRTFRGQLWIALACVLAVGEALSGRPHVTDH